MTELIIKINEIHRHLDFYLNKETYRQSFLYRIKKSVSDIFSNEISMETEKQFFRGPCT